MFSPGTVWAWQPPWLNTSFLSSHCSQGTSPPQKHLKSAVCQECVWGEGQGELHPAPYNPGNSGFLICTSKGLTTDIIAVGAHEAGPVDLGGVSHQSKSALHHSPKPFFH